MAKKAKTREDKLRFGKRRYPKNWIFLLWEFFFLIFAATAVNETLEAKGMTLRGLLSEVKFPGKS